MKAQAAPATSGTVQDSKIPALVKDSIDDVDEFDDDDDPHLKKDFDKVVVEEDYEEEDFQKDHYRIRKYDLPKAKRLNFDDENGEPAAVVKKSVPLTNVFDLKLYNMIWPRLKKAGWSVKPGSGMLSDWIYLAPGVTKLSHGAENSTLFKTEESLMAWVERNHPNLFSDAQKQKSAMNGAAAAAAEEEEETQSSDQSSNSSCSRHSSPLRQQQQQPVLPRQSQHQFHPLQQQQQQQSRKSSSSSLFVPQSGSDDEKYILKTFGKMGENLIREGCKTSQHLQLLSRKSEVEIKQLLGVNTGDALVLKEALTALFQ